MNRAKQRVNINVWRAKREREREERERRESKIKKRRKKKKKKKKKNVKWLRLRLFAFLTKPSTRTKAYLQSALQGIVDIRRMMGGETKEAAVFKRLRGKNSDREEEDEMKEQSDPVASTRGGKNANLKREKKTGKYTIVVVPCGKLEKLSKKGWSL